MSGFRYSLVDTGRFRDDVSWLAPDAGEEFRSLTARVWAGFPAYPPYGGQFDEVVAHLTVADHAPVGAMRAVDRSVRARLPISAVARAVTLMVEHPSGYWTAARSFALDGPGTPLGNSRIVDPA